jgi:hypothetical protein
MGEFLDTPYECVDLSTKLRRLFKAVCEASESMEKSADLQKRGWVVLHPVNDRENKRSLVDAWYACVGYDRPGKYSQVTGAPWDELLGIPGLMLDFFLSVGRHYGMRFRVGQLRDVGTKYNMEICRHYNIDLQMLLVNGTDGRR